MAKAVGVAKDNKTIAFYIGDLGKGGAERVMTNLAKFFRGQGYTVYLVTKTVSDGEYDVPEGVTRLVADITKDEETKSRILNLYRRVAKLRKIWKKIKPDIIVSFIRKNNIMAIASTRGLKIPVVVSIRSNPARELQGKLVKPVSFFLFRFASGIVMQTMQAKAYLPAYLQAKAIVLPNSLSYEFVEKRSQNIEGHTTARKKEIVAVGRIDDNKNQRMLLEVFDEIKHKYPEWSLHLYGEGAKAKELSDLHSGDQVWFHGQVSDVVTAISQSSIFALTSKQEGMPNALIEAMALGLACVSTDCPCGGPADLIVDGENGILIPVDDKQALRDALCELIEDEEKQQKLGDKARDIVDVLSPEIVNNKWLEYIEAIIKSVN